MSWIATSSTSVDFPTPETPSTKVWLKLSMTRVFSRESGSPYVPMGMFMVSGVPAAIGQEDHSRRRRDAGRVIPLFRAIGWIVPRRVSIRKEAECHGRVIFRRLEDRAADVVAVRRLRREPEHAMAVPLP